MIQKNRNGESDFESVSACLLDRRVHAIVSGLTLGSLVSSHLDRALQRLTERFQQRHCLSVVGVNSEYDRADEWIKIESLRNKRL